MNPAARERRFRRIKEIGCLACKSFGYFHSAPDVHHLNIGGLAGHKRRGDEFTIGLCPWHHRGVPPQGYDVKDARWTFGPSLALLPNKFREVYGTDDELLAAQNRHIEKAEKLRVGA